MKTLKEIIMEGRGRPRKNPAPAKAGDEYGPDNGVEPDQHIHVQLRKAAGIGTEEVKGKEGYKMKGGAEVKFGNGSHFVKAEHAKTVMHALEKLRPGDRDKLHAHIAASHDNFKAIHKLVS